MMGYPTLEQYNEALQYPGRYLIDPELKRGTIAKTGLGLPLALCGGFALTYTIIVGGKKYAVRCFHKESNNIEIRYDAISNRLKTLKSPYFLDFEFQANGVRVNGNTFPVVKMTWADGKTLDQFLESNYHNKNGIQKLNGALRTLNAYLEREHLSHGDIQPGNLMITNNGQAVQLIDYDGMFVDELKIFGSAELGLRNFQHPERNASHWNDHLDRFPFIAINFALRILEVQPKLWTETQSDAAAILFKANDFADPSQSKIFNELFNDSRFSEDAKNFASICKSSFDKVPTLEDFIARRNIPHVNITVSPITQTSTNYISAYPTLDATNYIACLEKVGDMVELIGEITDVFEGNTRYGTPYVFLNFGDWKGKITKIAIWSQGLETINQKPDKNWTGKWISVVGLMEPPYTTSKYSHLCITITHSNQLHIISETEAKYRIAGTRLTRTLSNSKTNNKEILREITKSASPVTLTRAQNPAQTVQAASPLPKTPNQNILQSMQGSRTVSPVLQHKPQSQQSKQTPTQRKPLANKTSSQSAKTSSWAWWGITIILICLFFSANANNSSLAQSTPTSRPKATATFKQSSTLSAILLTATQTADCINWTEVKKTHDKKQLCVYGIVTERKRITTNDNSWFLIRFDGSSDTFYITSERTLQVSIGDCIYVKSIINLDANKTPFMHITNLSIINNRCLK